MKLSVKVDQSTTASELIILAGTFESLALAREGHVVSVPASGTPPEETNGDDPTPGDTVVVTPHEVEVTPAGATLKRRRRTKAEIEADAVAAAEAEAQASNEAGLAQATAEAGNVEGVNQTHTPAPTQPATVTDTAPAQAPAEPEPASASPSDGKTYAAADVQQLATVVARTHGADLVKGKIAELGGARIADLKQEQLNALGSFLANVK